MLTSEVKIRNKGQVRVRMAPSPTGHFHIGNARTALFNYLFCQRYGGAFILRIDDTDRVRYSPEYETEIIDGLKWLGIEWQEGPDKLGPYSPYRQSERQDIYQRYIQKLLDEKKAYFCFCSKDDLETYRQYLMSRGEAPRYSGKCRELSEKQTADNLKQGKESIIRLKTSGKKVVFEDLIRGRIEYETADLGDIVIAKDVSAPLYNVASVIDDFEMKITHVIRGEDHIPNTPKQILMAQSLGFLAKDTPQYIHLPLILGPNRAKLSSRYGAVSLLEYRQAGYLPEAMINFLAFLGWNPGSNKEVLARDDLIKEFSVKGLHKAGAVFNSQKLDWLNGFYIRQESLAEITTACLPYLFEKNMLRESQDKQKYIICATGEEVGLEFLQSVVGAYRERLKKLSEIVDLAGFFFVDELLYSKELLRWKQMTAKDIISSLEAAKEAIESIAEKDFNKENLEKVLVPLAEKFGEQITNSTKDRGYLLWPLRAALTGQSSSAGPFEVAAILGQEMALKRLKTALNRVQE